MYSVFQRHIVAQGQRELAGPGNDKQKHRGKKRELDCSNAAVVQKPPMQGPVRSANFRSMAWPAPRISREIDRGAEFFRKTAYIGFHHREPLGTTPPSRDTMLKTIISI